ncbi:MFS transporter [Roseomonas sp. AR75]|uniref:MFS transporter n=1 Tax=Roseomonas sp. AR75 TaxID=2562311 RepID=UPI0010BFFDA3|nr:MFS transporter [Roseomonas sp. AR75]
MNGLGAALVATTGAQVLATLAVYLLPVLAPIAARDLGVGPELVGTQVAVIYAAAAITSIVSGGLLRRQGPARCTQLALLLCAAGSVALGLGGLPGAALGAVLLGIGYGLTTPAATQVLTRLTPAPRRNLVFAVKQMGVPLGGTLAGLLMPALALALGWRNGALIVALLLLLAVAALMPFRAAWDAGRGAGPGGKAALGTLSVLRAGRGLVAIAVMGALFSATQLSLGAFAVTMLVGEFGWSPVAAGAAAAAVQASGAVSRIAWAVLADRLRAGLPMLAVIGLGTGAAALAMPFALGWPDAAVLLLLCLFGTCANGWTGIAMAEVARLAPHGAAGAAAGGVMGLTYVGVVVGPMAFGALALLLGGYTAAFALVAALPLLGAAIALWTHRLLSGPPAAS